MIKKPNITKKDLFGSTFRTWGAAILGGVLGSIALAKSQEYGIDIETTQDLAEVLAAVLETEAGKESLVALIALKVLSVMNKSTKNIERQNEQEKVEALEQENSQLKKKVKGLSNEDFNQ